MGYDKPSSGSFAAAVFGGLAQGLSMVAQNKIANRREDELYQKEKADQEAALAENRAYSEGIDQMQWDRNLAERTRREGIVEKDKMRGIGLGMMEDRKRARGAETNRAQGREDQEYLMRLQASLRPGKEPKVKTKQDFTKAVVARYPELKNSPGTLRKIVDEMFDYSGDDIDGAMSEVLSNDYAGTVRVDAGIGPQLAELKNPTVPGDAIRLKLQENGIPTNRIPIEDRDYTPEQIGKLLMMNADSAYEAYNGPMADVYDGIIFELFNEEMERQHPVRTENEKKLRTNISFSQGVGPGMYITPGTNQIMGGNTRGVPGDMRAMWDALRNMGK